MTFVFELRGLAFGLLTATALASITALMQRIVKILLPRPANFDRKRSHVDGRDALGELVVSCEGVPALLSGPFVHRSAEGRASPPPLSRRIRIISLFILAFVITMFMETVLILASGSRTAVLTVPDISPYSFVMRHTVVNGAQLPPLENTTLNKLRCVVNSRTSMDDNAYYSYDQHACLENVLRKPANETIMPNPWTLYTEENQIDRLKLFVGEVFRVGDSEFEKNTWAQVTVSVTRLVTYNRTSLKRILDQENGRIVYRAAHNALPDCKVVEWMDNPLDRDLYDRPARLANFSCNSQITLEKAVRAMESASLGGIGLYYYEPKPGPKFRIPSDAQLIDKERLFKAGMTVSESYEDGWFLALSGITALGMLSFGLERCLLRNTYPNVAILSIMQDLSTTDENDVRGIHDPTSDSMHALTAHAQAVDVPDALQRSPSDNRRVLRFGFVSRSEQQSVSLQSVLDLPRRHFTFNNRAASSDDFLRSYDASENLPS